MKRVKITTKMRADIFVRHKGVCHLCQMKVVPGQEWDVSHDIPLEAGGKDDQSNWFVAHRKCHRIQTATIDIPLISRVKRISQRHIGATQSKNPMPGSRNSKFKRKMDGTVVMRKGFKSEVPSDA